MMRGAMAARLVAVRVLLIDLDGDEIELAVADTALGHHRLGELADRRRRSAQESSLEAVLVIEMRVHRRHRQIVMIMLDRRQSLGKFALVMIVRRTTDWPRSAAPHPA